MTIPSEKNNACNSFYYFLYFMYKKTKKHRLHMNIQLQYLQCYFCLFGHPFLKQVPTLRWFPFQGGTSFVDLLWAFLCFFFVFLCLLCLCASLFICALWSPAGKGLTSWLSIVVSNCESVTFQLVFWVRCGS